MNAIVEAKIESYLRQVMHYEPLECRTITRCARDHARSAGFALDERFARAGLGAGPECRVASGLVNLALGGGGCETSDDTIRACLGQWLRTRVLSA